MTETAQMNGQGGRYIDQIDPEDPEYIRQMRRPAEVKEDVAQMEQRQRVSNILTSRAFRDELERLVNETMTEGKSPTSLTTLERITELVLPTLRFNLGGTLGKGGGTIVPIADLRGVDSLNYGKGEKLLRCKLAACYRLVDLYGWSHTIHNHITARISQEHEHFLVNPFGLLYPEVTASTLVKVDMQGDTVDPGSTNLEVNQGTFALHGAIHAARPDVRCVLHLHTPSAIAVSSMECGLLALSQEAMLVGEPSTYNYNGNVADQEDRDHVARALGPNNKVLFLRNYGALCCGASVEEAFNIAFNLASACDTQVKAIPVGMDNLVIPSEELQRKAYEFGNQGSNGGIDSGDGNKKSKWRRGEMEFEALMRHLDNAGFRTGYMYREPNLRRDRAVERANADVEVPPSATSFSSYWDEMEGKSPLIKQQMEKQKKMFKSDWLNSPNAYTKEEFDEIGTPTPKKFTKWVPGSATSTPVRPETANQFAPLGPDPKELAQKHKHIRKHYYDENISAGPQSKVLEGMTWEEAQKIKEGHASGATTDTTIIVGAASKGIIQRKHQHNAVVYKTYYAPNPFDNMTEDEIDKYKQDIGGKPAEEGPESNELVPGPDGQLISSDERMKQIQQQAKEEIYPRRQYLETSLDDLVPVDSPNGYQEPASSPSAQDLKRSQSARYSPQKSAQLVGELQDNFDRKKSKSERKPKKKDKRAHLNGEGQAVASPTKSTSSGDGTMDETSPNKETLPPLHDSPSKEKKKKKKFRMPSFSSKKEKK